VLHHIPCRARLTTAVNNSVSQLAVRAHVVKPAKRQRKLPRPQRLTPVATQDCRTVGREPPELAGVERDEPAVWLDER